MHISKLNFLGRSTLLILSSFILVLFLVTVAPQTSFSQTKAFGEDAGEGDTNSLGLQFRRVEGGASSDGSGLTMPSLGGASPEQTEEFQKKQKELREKIRKEERETAVKQTKQTLFPLKPEEIEQMLEMFNVTREKAESAGKVVPKPEVKVADISLDPSMVPEVIMTAPGNVTTLSILDITGQPWPIQDVTWAGEFEVIPPEPKGHVIRITPLTVHGFGNISIRLIDLTTPVTFTLKTSPYISFYRFDARIPEYGPNASVSLIDQGPGIVAGDAIMTALLNGAPPENTVRLSVDGVDGRTSVWRSSGRVFVRTPLSLLSPGWTASASSADGMKIYQISESPVLLLSDKGNMVRAQVGKEEVVDDGE
ncbi:MAG: type IV secretion protein DotH [Rickettsiales bacterium]|nr:type IV secretion protein DotH [Rickettsiales bacterium]